MHGNEADLALVPRIAERLDDANLRHPIAVCAREFEADEVALLGRADVIGGDRPLPQLFAIDGVDDAASASLAAKDPEQPALRARDPFDRLGLVAVAIDVAPLQPCDACQNAVALAQHRLPRPTLATRRQHERPWALALGCVPGRWLPDEFPVCIASHDLEHGYRWQISAFLETLAVAAQQAFLGHLREQALQRDPLATLDVEGAGNLALARLGTRGAYVLEDVLLAWQARCAADLFGFSGHRGRRSLGYSAASRLPAGLALDFRAELAFSVAFSVAFSGASALTGLAAALAARGWERGGFLVVAPRLALGLAGPLAMRSAI